MIFNLAVIDYIQVERAYILIILHLTGQVIDRLQGVELDFMLFRHFSKLYSELFFHITRYHITYLQAPFRINE